MSTVKTNNLQAVSGGAIVPIADVINGSARAWVNFNGTGTVAILASYNVASITDNGVGDYTVNFTNAMADANYAMAGACRQDASTADIFVEYADAAAPTASACRVNTPNDAGAATDPRIVSIIFYR